MRISFISCVAVIVLALELCAVPCGAQSTNAAVGGQITDQQGRVVPGARVVLTNLNTGVIYETKANGDGIYNAPNVPPGIYRANVSKDGFKNIVKGDIELHVQDVASINFQLQIGSVTETVTVEGGAPLVNTTDGSVGTVVDRQFVENMPLNGRSLQTLIALTPGVVMTPATFSEEGQFSVNGQRADANYFSIDGVSANIGAGFNSDLVQNAAGAIPGLSILGGTNNLVSVDAVQEFRVQTSSFAPEYGRTPGGQIAILTRSGTNQFHGTVFNYFRNNVLDANDWFAKRNNLPQPQERQNDFGGVFGGPIVREKAFFFFSYEGLRLRQPQTAELIVPSPATRQATPAQLQPYVNAFPIPNGPTLANGFAQLNASFSDPSSLDAYSLRVDHVIKSNLTLFGRYDYAPSATNVRAAFTGNPPNDIQEISNKTHTLTLGLAALISPAISNEARANISYNASATRFALDSFGGAVPIPLSLVAPPGVPPERTYFSFLLQSGVSSYIFGRPGASVQRQVTALDNLSVTMGSHQLKLGVDYRWLSPFSSRFPYIMEPLFSGVSGPTGLLSGNTLETIILSEQSTALLQQQFSAYGQDTWKASRRLTLTYGLRWDVNPPLRGKGADSQFFVVQGLDNPATMTLGQRGAALYSTTYGNVAPRVGLAYELRQSPRWNTVLRGGIGTFYDLGSGYLGAINGGFPFQNSKILFGVPFPLSPQQALAPGLTTTPPVNTVFYAADPHLKLPRTYEWNVALEQSIGANQVASLTYVGATGQKLLRRDALYNVNATFPGIVYVTRNTGNSDYHALQLKLQRRLSHGLQALAAYTLSHSIDNSSTDSSYYTPGSIANPSLDRGNSDFDVRHNFTGALSYDIPAPFKGKIPHSFLGNWSVDSFILGRTALPVTIIAANQFTAGVLFQSRPNVVPGVPLYLYGSQYPGGKIFNKAASQAASLGQQGNFPRNFLRGFGAWQSDLAVRKQFHVGERVAIQFRTEFFNIFNHPNFGPPTNSLSSPLFGQSTQMLGASMGSGSNGGLNPLYQIGGPRSIQLALKLQF